MTSKYPSKTRKFIATVNNPFPDYLAPNEDLIFQGRDESREFLTESYLSDMFAEQERDGSLVKLTGQLELAPTTGTEHLQIFLQFKHPVSKQHVIKRFFKCAHIEQVNKDNGAEDYCMKPETRVAGPYTFCSPGYDEKKIRTKKTLREQRDMTPSEALEYYDNPSQILSWKKLKLDPMFDSEPYNHFETRGIWIYGPPGTGKTHWARNYDSNFYPKLANKWWDGYDNQTTIILEDLGISVGKMLRDHLKLWLDKWYFTAEVKGTAVQPRYHRFIITSNYSPKEIFTDDESYHDLNAILRRIKLYRKDTIDSEPELLN